jgi:transcriptional regulator with XRE-family HTH domain
MMSFTDIAAREGVSRQRIHQIFRGAMDKVSLRMARLLAAEFDRKKGSPCSSTQLQPLPPSQESARPVQARFLSANRGLAPSITSTTTPPSPRRSANASQAATPATAATGARHDASASFFASIFLDRFEQRKTPEANQLGNA